MAYNKTNLSVATLTGRMEPMIWDYSTIDTVSVASAYNYFADSDSLPNFRLGDIVRVTASDGKFISIVFNEDYLGGSIQMVTMANVSSF